MKRRFNGLAFFLFCLTLSLMVRADQEIDPSRPLIRLEGSPATGAKQATVTIVEFTDFECPFCGFVQPTLQEILERYPDQVQLVFKNYPLKFHRHAKQAHLAAMCADEQGKFWDYRYRLFQNQRALKKPDLVAHAEALKLDMSSFSRCLEEEKYISRIQEDVKEGLSLGVYGTPAFFINGRHFPGAQPFAEFQEIIEDELEHV